MFTTRILTVASVCVTVPSTVCPAILLLIAANWLAGLTTMLLTDPGVLSSDTVAIVDP